MTVPAGTVHPTGSPMPSLYIGHGAPPLLLDDAL